MNRLACVEQHYTKLTHTYARQRLTMWNERTNIVANGMESEHVTAQRPWSQHRRLRVCLCVREFIHPSIRPSVCFGHAMPASEERLLCLPCRTRTARQKREEENSSESARTSRRHRINYLEAKKDADYIYSQCIEYEFGGQPNRITLFLGLAIKKIEMFLKVDELIISIFIMANPRKNAILLGWPSKKFRKIHQAEQDH